MFKIVTTLDDLPEWNPDEPIFSDIETGGLYIDLRLIQFYQPSTDDIVYIYDLAPTGYDNTKYKTDVEDLKNYLKDKWTCWYNASYDLGTLNMTTEKFDDLYYAVKSAYPEFAQQGFGLKKIVKMLRYTQDMYKTTEEDYGAKGFPKGSYIPQSAFRYASYDVIALSKIWKDPKIRNIVQNNLAYKVDILSLKYAIQYQQNGLLLNREAQQKELKKAREDVVHYTALLPAGFNPNSYKQVREYLDIEKSDRETLTILSLGNDQRAKDADSIIHLKRAKKQVSYLESVNFNKMYTKFNVAGAVTGRFTSSGGDLPNGFNAQQIPRDYQYLFNSPTEETSVIGADYSTLELRLAAALYNEPVMYKLLKEGKDLHTEMAINISGKKLHEDGVIYTTRNFRDISDSPYIDSNDRQNAKVVNFGFVFGMSADKFIIYAKTSYGIEYTEEEGRNLRSKYFKLYPSIANYHKNIWKHYKDKSFVVKTALGRVIKPKLGTDAINVPVQGSGAETTKLAVHYLVKDYGEEVLNYIYNVVHDAIYLRVPAGTEDYWKVALNKSMIKGWTEISKTELFHFKDIPMIAEVDVYRYNQKKEVYTGEDNGTE